MKQLEVTILGQVYVLACPEGGETLIAAAVARVDQEMTAIRSAGKVKARERIAVLAALNLAYQLAERAAAAPAAAPVHDKSAPGHHMAARGYIHIAARLGGGDDALGDDGQLL